MPEALFWLFSTAAIVAGLGVVFSRQAIESVLWMFGLVLSISAVLVFLGATLVGLLLMLVYAGAIVVLFAFAAMFVGGRLPFKQVGRWRMLWACAALVVLVLLTTPLFALGINPEIFGADNPLTASAQYGLTLFGKYTLATQIVGWLLLWVTVGAFNILRQKEEQV